MTNGEKPERVIYREELPQIIIEKRKMLPDGVIQDS